MIDYVFDGIQAYNALGFLLGAFVFMFVGMICLGYWIYWRVASTRVSGRIVGVKSTGVRREPHEWTEHYQDHNVQEDEQGWDDVKSETINDFKTKPFRTALSGFFILIFVMMPFAFFIIGAGFAYNFISLKSDGIKTSAVIIDYETTYDSDNGTMYYPVVSFKDTQGSVYELKDKLGTGDRPFKTGERVSVFYDASDPERFVIDDFWRYMLFSLMFMGISGVFIALMLTGLFRSLSGAKDPVSGPDLREINRIKTKHYLNQKYIPVYEFRAPDGQVVEVDGVDDASNWLADKLPGKNVKLMLIQGDELKVKKPGVMFLLFGLIFFLPGLLFLSISIPLFEMNFASLSLFAAIIIFILYKGFKGKSKMRSKMRERSEKNKGFKFEISAHVGKSYLLNSSEITERLRFIDRQSILGLVILMFFSAGMIFGGYHLFLENHKLSSFALVAKGEVVSIERRSSSDSYTYYPVIKFQTLKGQSHTFRSSVGTNPPTKKVGDIVAVLYDPDKPTRAKIDQGFMNWLPSIALVLFGIILLYHGLKHIAGVVIRLLFSPRRNIN